MSGVDQIAQVPQSGADAIVFDLAEWVAEKDEFAARGP